MKKLKLVQTIELIPTQPFNFNFTFHKPDHFETLNYKWKSDVVWQTFVFNNHKLGIKFISKEKSIIAKIYNNRKLRTNELNQLKDELIYRYNLNLNLSEFYQSFKNDEHLKIPIKNLYGLKPAHPGSLYEYLVIGLVLQNANIKRSIQMLDNLFNAYGNLLVFDNMHLYCFWQPGSLKSVSETDLRKLKLGYRAKTLKKIDDLFRTNEIDELELRKLDINEQKKNLLKIYGVGPATVWYILFDVFHQYDFFDHISPWEQKILSKIIFGTDDKKPVSVKRLLKFFDRYGKYKQLALHYIWEYWWWQMKDN